jgi:hypothetical protein
MLYDIWLTDGTDLDASHCFTANDLREGGHMIRGFVTIALVATLAACSRQPDVNTDPASGAVFGSAAGMPDDEGRKSTAATLGIPPGHLPPAGQCVVWIPGEPPGQQKKKYRAGDCSYVERQVPPGGWLVYRPTTDKKIVRVSVYDSRRPDVIAIRVFDVETGALLRVESGG